jgi:diguanylate cyclase (GGDEF)-like protein
MRTRESDQGTRVVACLFVMAFAFVLSRYCAAEEADLTRLTLVGVYVPIAAAFTYVFIQYVAAYRARERHLLARIDAEAANGRRLCIASIEALAFAVEGRTSQTIGHLSRVQAYALATAQRLDMGEDEQDGLRVAAMVHDIGRLGIPDNILTKEGSLTVEEREKIRAYPALGSRLLTTIPFPWPIVPIVRHHREHFDGTGYPDGLSGDAIPLPARILAVVDAYDSQVSGGSHRDPSHHEEAINEIRSLAGTQFDPSVAGAFLEVVDAVNEQLTRQLARQSLPTAAFEVARANREVRALYEMACAVGTTLNLDDTILGLVEKIKDILGYSACVFFLAEEDDEWLQASAAFGVNHWHFRKSRARIGTYLTGRVAYRGEPVMASYMPDDVELRHSTEPWTPLRSTLIVPLIADGQVIGTINVYHEEPDAFGQDELRVMSLVGELAGRAINNARVFAQTQENAYTDAVTGLKNRRWLRIFLDQEINRARKNKHTLAVLGLDLDHFKPVNDTYGHERGDQVLREVGQVLQAQIRNYDLVARYAGDEFAVVLPEADLEKAEVVARKITESMDRYADRLVAKDCEFPRIGVSVGIALFPLHGDHTDSLLAYADQVMYENKRDRKAGRAA